MCFVYAEKHLPVWVFTKLQRRVYATAVQYFSGDVLIIFIIVHCALLASFSIVHLERKPDIIIMQDAAFNFGHITPTPIHEADTAANCCKNKIPSPVASVSGYVCLSFGIRSYTQVSQWAPC